MHTIKGIGRTLIEQFILLKSLITMMWSIDLSCIAILAPFWIEIPPKTYGGTETALYYLVLGLITCAKRGKLTLFAPAGTKVPFFLRHRVTIVSFGIEPLRPKVDWHDYTVANQIYENVVAYLQEHRQIKILHVRLSSGSDQIIFNYTNQIAALGIKLVATLDSQPFFDRRDLDNIGENDRKYKEQSQKARLVFISQESANFIATKFGELYNVTKGRVIWHALNGAAFRRPRRELEVKKSPFPVPSTDIALPDNIARIIAEWEDKWKREGFFKMPRKYEYIVGFAGLFPEKGLSLLIRVVKIVEEKYRLRIPLVLAGTVDWGREDSRNEYYKIVKGLDFENIFFVGAMDLQQKKMLLGNAKILANAIGWAEPFGMVIIEALALGTMVVSFALGALKEILSSGEAGVLVEVQDPGIGVKITHTEQDVERFADALYQSWVNPLSRSKVRKNARRWFHNYRSVVQHVEYWEEILLEE